jgi:hypothetical protein
VPSPHAPIALDEVLVELPAPAPDEVLAPEDEFVSEEEHAAKTRAATTKKSDIQRAFTRDMRPRSKEEQATDL